MNKLNKLLATAAVALATTQPALAGAGQVAEDPFADAFGGVDVGATLLGATEMEETRGRLVPLAIPLAIVGVDLALIGAFWGIYVPYYGGGSCVNCAPSSNLQ